MYRGREYTSVGKELKDNGRSRARSPQTDLVASSLAWPLRSLSGIDWIRTRTR